jgi:hypothetical protein
MEEVTGVGGACRSGQAAVVLVLSSAPARLGWLTGVEGGPEGRWMAEVERRERGAQGRERKIEMRLTA